VSEGASALQISVEEVAAWSRKLVITVPAGRVRSERGKIARQIGQRVRMPGFRKGKVPPERIESRFGVEIDRQTQQQLIDGAFREAIREKHLEPISEPRVAKVVYERDAELTFEVAFDIWPQIRLGRLGGFRLTRPAVTVRDEEVDEQIEVLRRQSGVWKPVERQPRSGDSVEVVITPLAAGGAAEESRPYRFVLGHGLAIPDVEAAITSLASGSDGEFEVKYPDDFEEESRRGTTQRMRIELKRVHELELPALNDEFARSVRKPRGEAGEFQDLGALRAALKEELHAAKQQEAERLVDRQLIDLLIEANPFAVPDSMVERHLDALLGAPPEGADPDLVARARDEARPAAIWGIKRMLIVQHIADDQGFEATKPEVDERLQAVARRSGRPLAEVRARLSKSGELRELERAITEEKVFKFLRESSEITGGS
jgi:trigger factor